EVARAGREVEDARPLAELERPHGAAPPAAVEAERQHAVHRVVAAGDPVEHRAAAVGRRDQLGRSLAHDVLSSEASATVTSASRAAPAGSSSSTASARSTWSSASARVAVSA